MNTPKSRRPVRFSAAKAFTLTEVLVVIVIIAVLAALLLPALSLGQGQSRSATCKNHLSQMGVALQMYVNDNQNWYPYYWGLPDPSLDASVGVRNTRFWWARLTPYYPLKWTDRKYHCPGYLGVNAGLEFTNNPSHSGPPYGSYAYNANGVSMPGFDKPYDPAGFGIRTPAFRKNT